MKRNLKITYFSKFTFCVLCSDDSRVETAALFVWQCLMLPAEHCKVSSIIRVKEISGSA